MVIGFDAKRVFHNPTGLGNYGRSLIQDLSKHQSDHSLHLYTPPNPKSDYLNFFSGRNNLEIHNGPSRLTAYWRTRGVVKEAIQHGVQLFHGLSNELPYGIEKHMKSVVTIHDLIFKSFPNWYPIIDRKIYNLKSQHACRVADKVIAVSEFTKQEIIKYYKIDANKITVIPPSLPLAMRKEIDGEALEQTRKTFGLPPNNFILYVGSTAPRKGLRQLLDAHARLAPILNIPLVIISNDPEVTSLINYQLSDKPGKELLFFYQNIDDQTLAHFYKAAWLFIYPSLFEGFGLPIIEAQRYGTPVVTNRVSSLTEAGGDAAYYTTQSSAESLAEAISTLANDPALYQSLVQKGFENIRHFDKQLVAEQLTRVYHQLL